MAAVHPGMQSTFLQWTAALAGYGQPTPALAGLHRIVGKPSAARRCLGLDAHLPFMLASWRDGGKTEDYEALRVRVREGTRGLKGGTANTRIKRLNFRRADCNIWTSDAIYRERGELRRSLRDLVLALSPRQGRTNPPLDLSIPASRRMACAEAGWTADVVPGSRCGY